MPITSKNLKKDPQLMEALAKVIDPELDLPITDMGLIYGAQLSKDGIAKITLTLTTVGCPLYPVIEADIKKHVSALKDVTDVTIDLTFDPPWNPEMMSDEAKAEMGL